MFACPYSPGAPTARSSEAVGALLGRHRLLSTGRSRDWRPQGADFFDLESPRASHGAPRGSRTTKGVEGNEMVAIWPEKNGPVLQQCTRGVPPRSYFAQQYLLAHGTCMGVSGGIILL